MTGSPDLAELVHDMRNELAVVMANLEGLVDGKLEPTPERFASMLQAIEQLKSLISQLDDMDVAPVTAANMMPINVCDLLDRQFTAMQAVAGAKNLTVSIARCPAPVAQCMHFYADPVRIGQIVKNVLINAVRYTPTGGWISIDCHRRADQLEVLVSDSGPGISEDERKRVFEPGFRGAAAAGTDGSGYGLATVKRLVEAQGGTITVAAEFKGGARFAVRLPGNVAADAGMCDHCNATTTPPTNL